MKFLNLDIRNFLTISTAVINLDSRGLLLLQGINDDDSSADSNGAGKSSIADALCWCLYGETARGESGDKIINRKVGKETCVAIEVEDGDALYRIERYRKDKTFKNALRVLELHDAGVNDLTKGTDKLTQEVVNKIIGCSYDVFRSAIYAGQENFPDLPGMTDRNLKMLVEEAAGVTILEAAYVEARARADVEKKALLAVKDQCVILKSSLEIHTGALESAIGDQALWDSGRNLSAESAIKASKEEVVRAKTLGDSIDPKKKATLVSAIAALNAKIDAVHAEHAGEKELMTHLNDACDRRTKLLAARDFTVKTLKNYINQLAALDHKIGCPCDSCGRPLRAEDLGDARTILDKKIAETRDALDAQSDAVGDAVNRAEKLTRELEAFRASMTDISETVAQRASLTIELEAIKEVEYKRDSYIAEAKRHMAEAAKLRAAESPYVELIARTEAKIKEARDQIAICDEEIAKKEARVARAEAVVGVFAPGGVRAHILDQVTPFLNAQTSKYLSVLSDGNINATWTTLTKTAKGELREKFAIEINSVTAGETFGLISGGEKRKVRLATALALQDLVASRATKPIELFFGDEIDDALDAAGLERLMVILEEKARERGTVMIISHNDLKMWIGNVVTVTKRDGLATITETTE